MKRVKRGLGDPGFGDVPMFDDTTLDILADPEYQGSDHELVFGQHSTTETYVARREHHRAVVTDDSLPSVARMESAGLLLTCFRDMPALGVSQALLEQRFSYLTDHPEERADVLHDEYVATCRLLVGLQYHGDLTAEMLVKCLDVISLRGLHDSSEEHVRSAAEQLVLITQKLIKPDLRVAYKSGGASTATTADRAAGRRMVGATDEVARRIITTFEEARGVSFEFRNFEGRRLPRVGQCVGQLALEV